MHVYTQAMGVDFPDPEEFIPEATAGEREGAEAGTGGQEPLPEPDSEGRKMAESQEVPLKPLLLMLTTLPGLPLAHAIDT